MVLSHVEKKFSSASVVHVHRDHQVPSGGPSQVFTEQEGRQSGSISVEKINLSLITCLQVDFYPTLNSPRKFLITHQGVPLLGKGTRISAAKAKAARKPAKVVEEESESEVEDADMMLEDEDSDPFPEDSDSGRYETWLPQDTVTHTLSAPPMALTMKIQAGRMRMTLLEITNLWSLKKPLLWMLRLPRH
jgi:hypothetical protein